MVSLSLIGAFIPTAFFVSITPGMCMTLALTMGMTIGVRRTVWMMMGELVASQGFVTAIANPKGWAFMVALLPPFISLDHAIAPQLSVLVAIILVTELICMTLYATGGRSLRHFLEKSGNVRILNRIAGTLMIAVGIWLASS